MDGVEGRDNLRVVGHGDRAGSPPVETAAEGDDPVLAGMERCEFQRVLIGLGPGVHEEQGGVVAARNPADPVGERLLEGVDDAVGVEADPADAGGSGRWK